MNGREFVRRARRYSRKTGQDLRFDPRHGKGSHGTLHLGDRHTTVPHKEIGAGLLASMLKNLNIPGKDF